MPRRTKDSRISSRSPRKSSRTSAWESSTRRIRECRVTARRKDRFAASMRAYAAPGGRSRPMEVAAKMSSATPVTISRSNASLESNQV